MNDESLSLDFHTLREAYRSGRLSPADVIRMVYERIAAKPRGGIWIYLRPMEEALVEAEKLAAGAQERLPLYGFPFAIKDNLDVAGVPTTCACAEFAYTPERTAFAIARLQAAGAIWIGKTNLDQFATGLVGVRSPYGACENAFDASYISGGSSSGSAVAVATGLASFAVGTDTAGSGRVPAAFNNLVGYKPTRGWLSTSGLSPACRSLDCVSIFALTVEDAETATEVAAGFDESDAYSRRCDAISPAAPASSFRFGVPARLEFFGDQEAESLFQIAVERLSSLGGTAMEIDYTPFQNAASLLYRGPWIAERWQALRYFYANHADAFHPTTRQVIEAGAEVSGAEVFSGLHQLKASQRSVAKLWRDLSLVLLPTAASIYTIAAVEADPITLNARLGYYTNFVNLLDLAAIAVPSGFRSHGLPFGISLIGPAGSDRALAHLASRYHRAVGGKIGATLMDLARLPSRSRAPEREPKTVELAVVGAHLSELPLNHHLTDLGATLLRKCRTAPRYRLYHLPATTPPKPGLVRASNGDGATIEVEVWQLPEANFGAFISLVQGPLGIGTLTLEDGSTVKGFLCEHYATVDAKDITQFAGWKNYLAADLPDSVIH